MVVYNCKRCGYTTNNRSYIRKHFTRVKPCNAILQDIPIVTLLSEITSVKSKKSPNMTKNGKKTQKNEKNTEKKNLKKNKDFTPELSTDDIIIETNLQNYGKDEKNFLCSRNVSINFVTKEPPDSSSDNMYDELGPTPIMHKKTAAFSKKNAKIEKKTFVTKEPPESCSDNLNSEIIDPPIVQSKNLEKNLGCSRNVSMNFVTKEPPDSLCEFNDNNITKAPIMHKNHAAKKYPISCNINVVNNQENHDDSSFKNDYRNDNCPESPELHHRNIYNLRSHDNTIDSNYNIMHESSTSGYDNKIQENCSKKYYNNFTSPPIINARSKNKYSPTKLRRTYRTSSTDYNYSCVYNTPQNHNTSKFEYSPEYDIEDISPQYHCSYCDKIFNHRQSKYRHEKNCSSKIGLAHKCSQLEEKLEERDAAIEKLKNQMEEIMDKVGGEVHNHNHNTTNYTYNIVLNAFGNESTEYINATTVKEILEQGPISSIPKLVQMLHFNPEHVENHNVRIPSRKENIAKIWDGTKWVYHDKQRTITTMTNKAYSIINTHYSEGSNKQIDEFNSQYEDNDKTIIRRVNKDTELMILNNTSPGLDMITWSKQ